ncbi:hypothetical protein [Pseudonocardia sp. 73-21]|uniref:hypothetical protein n=1 Tax=Pseudonocardia sp. 73-21 TaxID=1895809 RepID=UPI000969E0E8|nr:hypothetical protein [Pseudonocardia sp. 73-21]OJY42332.1 MAG: hypothetical protein BGP03_10320 [Pseudonocardia sp. 73-21]
MTSLHNDERPVAIIRATAAADAWRSATLSQRAATPDHSDFYNLTGEVVDTLQALSHLFAVLRIQIAGYGDRRTLRDDEPGHDPAERLIMACGLAGLLQRDLDVAEQAAQRFWSEIGHIAVEDPS